MKRPKTYRFTDLWDERATERATAECRTDRPMKRRRGRPTGETFRLKAEAKLRTIRRRLKTESVEAVAASLGIPAQLLTDWLLDTRRD